VSGLGDLALLGAIKAFAKGKRWRVLCGTCGAALFYTDVSGLGRGLLDHAHGGDVSLTIRSDKT
jgi:hypothetical protein